MNDYINVGSIINSDELDILLKKADKLKEIEDFVDKEIEDYMAIRKTTEDIIFGACATNSLSDLNKIKKILEDK